MWLHSWLEVLRYEGPLVFAVVGQVHGHQPDGVAPPLDGSYQLPPLLLRPHLLRIHCYQPAAV
jgi:hypothetical protein